VLTYELMKLTLEILGGNVYGSIFHMKAKAGQKQKISKLFDAWERNRRPHIDGAMGGLVMMPSGAPGAVIAVAIFRDEGSYRANSDDPAQGEWYQKLRALLEEDPTWEDGEFVSQTIG
jgi:hypothetical protein